MLLFNVAGEQRECICGVEEANDVFLSWAKRENVPESEDNSKWLHSSLQPVASQLTFVRAFPKLYNSCSIGFDIEWTIVARWLEDSHDEEVDTDDEMKAECNSQQVLRILKHET